jgi:hypothetical protein
MAIIVPLGATGDGWATSALHQSFLQLKTPAAHARQ